MNKKQLLRNAALLLVMAIGCLLPHGAKAQTYHESDKAALRAFLRQPSAIAGKLNLEQLGLTIADTVNWQTSEGWVDKVSDLSWDNDIDWAGENAPPKRLTGFGPIVTFGWGENLAGNLDLSVCDSLAYLYCSNNQLTQLNISGSGSLLSLSCSENRLLLSNLYAISQKVNIQYKGFENQNQVFFTDTILALNGTLDFGSQKAFGYPAVNTVFTVKKSGGNAIENTDYTINNGLITFKTTGIYTVEMTNSAIGNEAGDPVKATTGGIFVGMSPNLPLAATLVTTKQSLFLGISSALGMVQIDWGNDIKRIYSVSTDTNAASMMSGIVMGDTIKIYGEDILYIHCQNLTHLNLINLSSLRHLSCDDSRLTELNLTGLNNLKSLNCSSNNLKQLDLTGLNNLQSLDCQGNQLTQLNLTGLNKLESLFCSNNQFGQLNFTGLNNLQSLYCSNTQLTQLTLAGLNNLEVLHCNYNQLSQLNLSGLTNLQTLGCSDNQLTQLNLTGLNKLEQLFCSKNQLTGLNLAGLNKLKSLDCYNNRLPLSNMYDASQKITNTDNKELGTQYRVLFNDTTLLLNGTLDLSSQKAFGNPAANTVFTVKKGFYPSALAMPGTDYTISNGVITFKTIGVYNIEMTNDSIKSNSQYPAKAVTGDILVNTSFDFPLAATLVTKKSDTRLTITAASGMIQVDWGNGIKETMAVDADTTTDDNWYFSFPAKGDTIKIYGNDILYFRCSGSQLTQLNLFESSTLQTLICNNNQLTQLNLSGLSNLKRLICNNNQLTALDVSKNTALTELDCNKNKLNTLNLAGLSKLKVLDCYDNELATLNTNSNTALTELFCYNNQLTQLNLTGLNNLKILDCYNNELNKLNLTGLSNLKKLSCYNNVLKTLDISPCTALTEVGCGSNQLTQLNLTGLNNLEYFDCYSNQLSLSDLYAVSQKIGVASNMYLGTQKPVFFADTTLSLNGTLDFSSQKAFGNPAVNTVFTVKKGNNYATANTDYSVNNGLITFKTPGAYTVEMTNAAILSDYRYPAKAITGDIWVNIPDNLPLAATFVTQAPNVLLYVSSALGAVQIDWGNKIKKTMVASTDTNSGAWMSHITEGDTIKIYGNDILYLECSQQNQLTQLNVAGLNSLRHLYCSSNQLTQLDLSGLTNLQTLNCSGNQLPQLNLSGLSSLQNLYCSSNQLTTLNLTGLGTLKELSCSGNLLTTLNPSICTNLQSLDCSYNQLAALNLTGLNKLESLRCSYNLLTQLNLSNLSNLTELQCQSNRLPLSHLYAQKKSYGIIQSSPQQPVFFADTILAPNSSLDFSSQKAFGNPASNTVFVIKKGEDNALINTDYTITDGVITFKTTGTYTVEMTHDSIRNYHYGYYDGPTTAITGTIRVTGTTYTITASAGANGSISPSGNVKVAVGDNQGFTFTPNSGYLIDQVLVDGINNSQAVTTGTYTFSNVQVNHSIAVSFKLKQYTITASVSGGNGTISPVGDSLVNHGSNVTYIFAPNNGYQINQVLVDGVNKAQAVAEGTYTLSNVASNHNIVVNFKLKSVITHTISASVNGGNGSISPVGNSVVNQGGNVTYTFTPNTGYQIDQVLIDGTNNNQAVVAGTYTFSDVQANHSIMVSFRLKSVITYTITASISGGNGTISPVGDSVVNQGSNVTYTFTSNTGYQIDQVLIDGTNNSQAVSSGTYTFTNITANHSIVVSFKVTTGIAETTAKANSLKVYPNPTSSQLIINNEELIMNEAISIYDMMGKLVETYKATGIETMIDIAHLPAGNYIIKVQGQSFKIVKQ